MLTALTKQHQNFDSLTISIYLTSMLYVHQFNTDVGGNVPLLFLLQDLKPSEFFFFFFFFFFLVFCLFRATPKAYGSSLAGGRIRAVAASQPTPHPEQLGI